jgi:hypothetical protein
MLNSNVELDSPITLPHPEAMLAGARLAQSLENDPFTSWFSGMNGWEILRDQGRVFLAGVDEWRIELRRMQESGTMKPPRSESSLGLWMFGTLARASCDAYSCASTERGAQ